MPVAQRGRDTYAPDNCASFPQYALLNFHSSALLQSPAFTGLCSIYSTAAIKPLSNNQGIFGFVGQSRHIVQDPCQVFVLGSALSAENTKFTREDIRCLVGKDNGLVCHFRQVVAEMDTSRRKLLPHLFPPTPENRPYIVISKRVRYRAGQSMFRVIQECVCP